MVVGGQNAKQLVAQTEVFDGKSWKQSADLPTPREHLAAVSDGVYVYAVGGRFLSSDKNSAGIRNRCDDPNLTCCRIRSWIYPRNFAGKRASRISVHGECHRNSDANRRELISGN